MGTEWGLQPEAASVGSQECDNAFGDVPSEGEMGEGTQHPYSIITKGL